MPKTALILILTGLLSGCSGLAYYSQAVNGHLEILASTRPIQELVNDPATDSALRIKLEQTKLIRDFASRELALPDNDSYRHYVDLGRPFVVWNVSAASEFSLRPEQWCMPIVGCVSYRGFYDRQAAEQLATEMRQQGFDTYVSGVPAYSTLGYFSDPVLNTFLRFGDGEVARLIFHELAHQRVYVAGDTAFNESFAVTVELEGVRRWLTRNGKPEAATYAAHRQRERQFADLVAIYRDKLGEVYAAKLSVEAKRQAKAKVIADLRSAYGELKATWNGYSGYDKWFEVDLNNAKIAALAVYTQLVPAFQALLEAEDHNLSRFYARVEALAGLSKPERLAALKQTPAKVGDQKIAESEKQLPRLEAGDRHASQLAKLSGQRPE